jgi:hypothetical protein
VEFVKGIPDVWDSVGDEAFDTKPVLNTIVFKKVICTP